MMLRKQTRIVSFVLMALVNSNAIADSNLLPKPKVFGELKVIQFDYSTQDNSATIVVKAADKPAILKSFNIILEDKVLILDGHNTTQYEQVSHWGKYSMNKVGDDVYTVTLRPGLVRLLLDSGQDTFLLKLASS